jgi:hypothetical protein
MSPPVVFYHGTAASNVPGILARGLVPEGGIGADAYARENLGWGAYLDANPVTGVYFTPDEKIAAWYAKLAAVQNNSTPAVLKLAIPPAALENAVDDERGEPGDPSWGKRYRGAIPPAWIDGRVPDAEVARLKTPPVGKELVIASILEGLFK